MLGLSSPILGQVCQEKNLAQDGPSRLSSAGEVSETGRFLAIRVIVDPHTHAQWLVERDSARPFRPARIRLITPAEVCPFTRSGHEAFRPFSSLRAAVIHAGEQVEVIEHTATVEARLEAIALSEAAVGETILVRLKANKRTVRGISLGSGFVALSPGPDRRHP